jgi:hypothetical protein
MKKGGFKSSVLIFLRKINLISKKQMELKPMKVRTVVGYDDIYTDLEVQRHVFIINKLSVRKGCEFNPETKSCDCGANLDEFLTKKYC